MIKRKVEVGEREHEGDSLASGYTKKVHRKTNGTLTLDFADDRGFYFIEP